MKKKKVLLVSHEAVTRWTMSTLLTGTEECEIEVTEAISCGDGIKLIREGDFDLVITDNKTADDKMTGFDVAREVNGKHDGSKVLIAAYCLSADESQTARLLEVNGFLQKPFDPGLFTFIVYDLLKK